MLKTNKTGWLKKTIHLDFWVYVLFLTTNGERKYESMEKISIWVCIKQKIWLLKHMADAELHRLEAHTAMEYASSVVSYEDARIKRLRKFLADAEKTV